MSKRVVKLNKEQFDQMVQTIYEQTISSMNLKTEGFMGDVKRLFKGREKNPNEYDPTQNAMKNVYDKFEYGDLDDLEVGDDVEAIKGPDVIDPDFDKSVEIREVKHILSKIYETIFSVKDSEKFKEYLRNYKQNNLSENKIVNNFKDGMYYELEPKGDSWVLTYPGLFSMNTKTFNSEREAIKWAQENLKKRNK